MAKPSTDPTPKKVVPAKSWIVPDTIINPFRWNAVYKKGRYLGKGSSAICYDFINEATGERFAVKAVPLTLITKDQHIAYLKREIEIQRSVNHENIVKCFGYFSDNQFFYIMLELCPNRSLLEMHRRRGTLTDSEIRYFLRQIADGMAFLHGQGIIHRDLKLGNLFLNENMVLKIGDFGLANRVSDTGLNVTFCGTPNYIAPEILKKEGHAYAADSWSLGCILYVLATGHAPFETKTVQETYEKIKAGDVDLSKIINDDLGDLISRFLSVDSSQRPTMEQVRDHPYLVSQYIPRTLPISCLTVRPHDGRLSIMAPEEEGHEDQMAVEKAMLSKTQQPGSGSSEDNPFKSHIAQVQTNKTEMNNNRLSIGEAGESKAPASEIKDQNVAQEAHEQPSLRWEFNPSGYEIKELQRLLTSWSEQSKKKPLSPDWPSEECEDPSSAPIFYVTRWVDVIKKKYGFAYELSDGSVGMWFVDDTRLILLENDACLFIDSDGVEISTEDQLPDNFGRKRRYLGWIRNHMKKNLKRVEPDEGIAKTEEELIARRPYLNNLVVTRNLVGLHFTNGMVQVNFRKEHQYKHIKMILCPRMASVTLIDEHNHMRAFKFETLEKLKLNQALHDLLEVAVEVVDTMISFDA